MATRDVATSQTPDRTPDAEASGTPAEDDADARAVPARQERAPGRAAVLPPRRLLRDVLRGRRTRRADPRRHPHHAQQEGRCARSRCAACRTTPSQSYVAKLLAAGLKVAICDQMEEPTGQADRRPRRRARLHARHGDRGGVSRPQSAELSGGRRTKWKRPCAWPRSISRPATCASPRSRPMRWRDELAARSPPAKCWYRPTAHWRTASSPRCPTSLVNRLPADALRAGAGRRVAARARRAVRADAGNGTRAARRPARLPGRHAPRQPGAPARARDGGRRRPARRRSGDAAQPRATHDHARRATRLAAVGPRPHR